MCASSFKLEYKYQIHTEVSDGNLFKQNGAIEMEQDFQNSQHFQNPQNPPKEIRTKSGFVAFVLGLLLGFFGVDRFYKGDFWLGVLKFCTAGGFGLWWLIDLFIVPAAVSRGEYSHLSTPQRLFLGSFIAVMALSIIFAKAQIHKEGQADTNPQIENSTLSF